MADRQHFSKTENFNEAQAKFRHLREYVARVSQKEGIPEFKTKLDRKKNRISCQNLLIKQ